MSTVKRSNVIAEKGWKNNNIQASWYNPISFRKWENKTFFKDNYHSSAAGETKSTALFNFSPDSGTKYFQLCGEMTAVSCRCEQTDISSPLGSHRTQLPRLAQFTIILQSIDHLKLWCALRLRLSGLDTVETVISTDWKTII